VASLVDTDILVYRFDPRDPIKQVTAGRLLESGIAGESLVLSHQSIIEFVAAVTRPQRSLRGKSLLSAAHALLEAEDLMAQFLVLYPTRHQVLTAMRGTAAYGLRWFDAQIWACAEVNGLSEIFTEDFQHGRHYGSVRAVNPFLAASGEVHELPAMYEAR
jgi:predicted nucleic acid-binding protein